jgi:predicted enzyme related to lactoylglutathione lyase
MHTISSYRLAALLALTAMLGAGSSLSVSAATPFFQPLNSPASRDHNPGKFIWADLFTTDPVAAAKFYTGLFGWTTNKIEQDGKTYTVFSNGKRPVAGLAPRSSSNVKRSSRWIGYIAVKDISATLALVPIGGGQVRAPAREFPDRGWQAIIGDNEGCIVGVLQSSSGDTADDEPKPGDLNWFELYVKDPQAVSVFYGQVFGYKVAPDERTERKNDFLLSSGDLARAGVAPLPDDGTKSGWLAVVRVDNLDALLARVPALGGEVLVKPRPVAYESRFAIIADSTGGSIGLVEYPNNANPANRP